MSLINSFVFTKTVIDMDSFLEATHNQYRVVSVREYSDKNGKLKDGVTLTLQVLKDDFDYGVDKNGVKRENNVFCNFDATVLNRNHNVKKGDIIALLDFNAENSFAISFDLVLRFNDLKVLKES